MDPLWLIAIIPVTFFLGFKLGCAASTAPLVNATPDDLAHEAVVRASIIERAAEEIRNADYRDRERQRERYYAEEGERVNRLVHGWLNDTPEHDPWESGRFQGLPNPNNQRRNAA